MDSNLLQFEKRHVMQRELCYLRAMLAKRLNDKKRRDIPPFLLFPIDFHLWVQTRY